MGTISTGIELNDNFSSVLYNIMGSVNLAIYQMEEMRQSLSAWISLIDNANAALANAGFGTILDGIRELGETAERVMGKIGIAVGTTLTILSPAFQFMQDAAGFIADNWSILEPIVWGLIAALVVYNATMGIAWLTTLQNIAAKIAHALASAAETVAIFALIAAQDGLNAALAACPLTWIIILIIAIITLIYTVCTAIAKLTGAANTGLGIIVGALSVAVAAIGNLFVALINMVIDIFVVLWNFIATFANFFGNVFNDPVAAIGRLFFGLVNHILGLLETLASAIDTLFGQNLAGAVQGWRDNLGDWVDKTYGKGEEIMATVNGNEWHVERFKYTNAWNSGVQKGDEFAGKMSDFLNGFGKIPKEEEYTKGYGDDSTNNLGDTLDKSGTGNKVADIANSAGNIENTLTATSEDLKYLRDIAERDTINRFTTAEISIVQTNNNKIASDMDLDGVVEGLTSAVDEAISNATEGVH